MSEQTCNSCNWTNVSLLKINGKFICHGCIQSELTDLRSRLEKSEAELKTTQSNYFDNHMESMKLLLDNDVLQTHLTAARAVVDAVRPLNIYIVNTLVAAYDAIVNQQPKKK